MIIELIAFYFLLKVDTENWGADAPLHSLKKESNWLEFVQLYPIKDVSYEKDMAKLRQRQALDQYILPHNSFLELNNDEVINAQYSFILACY